MPAEKNFESVMVVGINELPQKLAIRLDRGFIGHFVEEVSQGLDGTSGHIG
jgi:hypothetical protein